jgi:cell wall-associated NlpC family hydrolase
MHIVQQSVSVGLADIRREPDPGAELVTQALMNEPVVARRNSDAWSYVELRDYSGWIRSNELAEEPRVHFNWLTERELASEMPYAVVHVPSTPLYTAAEGADACDTLYLSTTLPLLATQPQERYQVALHGGRSGWLDAGEVAVRADAIRYPLQPLRTATSYARAFFGVPYLWGGKSWRGIDCSGLVQLCYLMAGHLLPRDADQQYEALGPAEIHPDRMREGDLVFFGRGQITHVALALDHHTFIHAEGQRFKRVLMHSLDPTDERYDRHLANLVCSIKRVRVEAR